MREVNNNTVNSNNVSFQQIQPKRETAQSEDVKPQTSEITDLGKMPSEVIGRSQVSKSSLEKDMDFALKNPDKVEDMNRYCDYLMNELGYSYEDACTIVGASADEFYGA